jgi:hypothetical protein
MNRNRTDLRTDQRIARFAISLGLVAFLAAGCAARTTSGDHGVGQVPVSLADRGQTVTAQVGQVIRVSLGAPSNGGAWTLASYPKAMLSITSSDPERGQFTFQARAKGQGLVGFTLLGKCGPPLLEAMPEGSMCPDSGRAEGVKGIQPSVPVPATLITYTVRVS